jgi:hypothetical protein
MGPRSATGRLRSLLLAATVTLLWLPATASAVTFGADLNQPANNPTTCAGGWPNQLYQGNPFEQPFYNTGNSSCMWTGSGVAQTLYAPSSGTVTSVRVKVGAVSGQMQIVVIRTLYRNTFEPGRPELACCVIEHYGPVNLPVGAKGKVTIKLNSAGKQATRHKRLNVWANFTFGSTKLSKRITLHG